jgi:hypothetical protein
MGNVFKKPNVIRATKMMNREKTSNYDVWNIALSYFDTYVRFKSAQRKLSTSLHQYRQERERNLNVTYIKAWKIELNTKRNLNGDRVEAFYFFVCNIPVDEQIPARLPQARLTKAGDISGLHNHQTSFTLLAKR